MYIMSVTVTESRHATHHSHSAQHTGHAATPLLRQLVFSYHSAQQTGNLLYTAFSVKCTCIVTGVDSTSRFLTNMPCDVSLNS